MNSDERFCELAHKSLAKEARPPEQAELEALLAENPALKKEFEEMGAEAAIAREILPLLERIDHPVGQIPRAPMERLKKEVGNVFERQAPPIGEMRSLLARLEAWGRETMQPNRERVLALATAVRTALRELSGASDEESRAAMRARILSGEEPMGAEFRLFAPMQATPSAQVADVSSSLLRARGRAAAPSAEEIVVRLRRLEARVDTMQHLTRECAEDIAALLSEIARSKREAHPKPED